MSFLKFSMILILLAFSSCTIPLPVAEQSKIDTQEESTSNQKLEVLKEELEALKKSKDQKQNINKNVNNNEVSVVVINTPEQSKETSHDNSIDTQPSPSSSVISTDIQPPKPITTSAPSTPPTQPSTNPTPQPLASTTPTSPPPAALLLPV